MKKILYLIIPLFFISCEIQYDGGTKLVVDTKLVDRNGNPIANKNIKIFVREGTVDLISEGTTKMDGTLLLIFPQPRTASINIEIETNNDNFQYKNFFNLKPTNFTDYKFDLNPLVLYKNDEITQFLVTLNQTSVNKEIRNLRIEGLLVTENEYFNDDNDIIYPLQTSFMIATNQNLVLKYEIKDFSNSGMITSYSTNFSVSNDAINYTLNY